MKIIRRLIDRLYPPSIPTSNIDIQAQIDELEWIIDRLKTFSNDALLDQRIARAIDWEPSQLFKDRATFGHTIVAPQFTTSIDAANITIPGGWSILSAWNGQDCICQVHSKPLGHMDGEWPVMVKADSEALARTTAGMRIRLYLLRMTHDI